MIELLSVCDAIIEDGELSYDEIYKLAEWMNNHEEACHDWPGNLLVEPLQRVWADGKIMKTEARDIARLILRIQKEAAKREAAESLARAHDAALEAARVFDLTKAAVPLVPFKTRVKSRTEKGVVYEVDLSATSCSCPDFRSFRRVFPVGHLTRCCKHVFSVYEQLEPEIGWPGWVRAFFTLGWTPRPRQDWMVLKVDSGLTLISSAAASGWASVFAADRGPYEHFGYNIEERRWAYQMPAPAADRLSDAIAAFSKHQERRVW